MPAITPDDWGRIYAYLFWVKEEEASSTLPVGHPTYADLRDDFEKDPFTTIPRIRTLMTDATAPDFSYNYLFEAWFPSAWTPTFLDEIAQGVKPDHVLIIRMSS